MAHESHDEYRVRITLPMPRPVTMPRRAHIS
jgi:hypothetical protein